MKNIMKTISGVITLLAAVTGAVIIIVTRFEDVSYYRRNTEEL